MWYLISVDDASPATIFVVANACLISTATVCFENIETCAKTSVPSRVIVNVSSSDDPVLVITIFVTTVVVLAGTVYSVAEDVENAPLDRAFIVVVIFYLLQLNHYISFYKAPAKINKFSFSVIIEEPFALIIPVPFETKFIPTFVSDP